MMDAKSLPAINAAVNRLMGLLATKQDELRRRETSQGTMHDVQKMVALRKEIPGIEKRLARVERLQEDIFVCQRPNSLPESRRGA